MAYKQLNLTAKVAIVVAAVLESENNCTRSGAAGADVVASARRMELVQALADEIDRLAGVRCA